MLRWLYLSPLGVLISLCMNLLRPFKASFMIYGYRDRPSRQFRKFTRISTSAILEERAQIAVGDHVWIGHFCTLDGSGGLDIGTGVHLAARVGIFTHGSHIAIRLYGADYIKVSYRERIGYVREPVSIGEFTFVGTGSTILPGVTIGRGCMVAAGAVVAESVPDFAVVRGVPAKVVGDTRELDRAYLDREEIRARYFDQRVVEDYLAAGQNCPRD